MNAMECVLNPKKTNQNRWYLLLVYWFYRLLGATKTQAEWKVRELLSQPEKAKTELGNTANRVQEARFHCVCGQLLAAKTRICHRCDRRQFMPHWLRVLERTLRRLAPGGRPATVGIILTMVLGYALQLRYETGASMSQSGFPLSLYALGAAFPDLTLNGQLWRSVSYSWLHGGAWHIVMNAIVVIQIVPLAEEVYGSARVFLAWWLCAIAGAVLPFIIFGGEAPVIGASGSNFGIMGMAMVFGHRLGTSEGKRLRDTMILWAVLSTVFGLSLGGIAHGAHFAGLGMGILLSICLPAPTTPARRRLTVPVALFAIMVLGWATVSTVRWMGSDLRPPQSLDTFSQARYLYGLSQVQGDNKILGAKTAAFLERVRKFKKQPNRQRESLLVAEKDSLMGELSNAEALVFEQRIREIIQAP